MAGVGLGSSAVSSPGGCTGPARTGNSPNNGRTGQGATHAPRLWLLCSAPEPPVCTMAAGRPLDRTGGSVRHRPLVLLFAVAALLCGPVLALAPQARAHNSLIGSVPADGATVTAPLTRVLLGFVDPPSGNATFAVVSPSGERVDDSLATDPQPFGGYTVTLGLKPLSETGRYTVEYFTVALDGVPLSGKTSFIYTGSGEAPGSAGSGVAPGSAGSGVAPGSAGSGEAPGSRLPVAALLAAPLLLFGAMFVVMVLRRHQFPTPANGPIKPASCPECGETVTPVQSFCVLCGAPLR